MMARSYAATELRNIPAHLINSSNQNNGGGNNGGNVSNSASQQIIRSNNHSNYAVNNPMEFDVGYDTDSIAIFEIDKAFTDYLLCQICFKMSRDAKECDYCNKLYCKLCIENWLIMNKDCPMCHLDIKIRGASRVVKEIIYSFRIQCSHCPAVVRLSDIEKHETQCGKVVCDNPLCQKPLKNLKYYQVVTSEGKLNVCNDICEQMAKFDKLR